MQRSGPSGGRRPNEYRGSEEYWNTSRDFPRQESEYSEPSLEQHYDQESRTHDVPSRDRYDGQRGQGRREYTAYSGGSEGSYRQDNSGYRNTGYSQGSYRGNREQSDGGRGGYWAAPRGDVHTPYESRSGFGYPEGWHRPTAPSSYEPRDRDRGYVEGGAFGGGGQRYSGFGNTGYGGMESQGYAGNQGQFRSSNDRGSTGFRNRGPKGYTRSDERIREDVSDQLMQDDFVDCSDVEVEVKDGVITLTGSVPSRDCKYRAEVIAECVAGCKDVENKVRVKRDDDSRSQTSTGRSSSSTNSGSASGSSGSSLSGSGSTSTGKRGSTYSS